MGKKIVLLCIFLIAVLVWVKARQYGVVTVKQEKQEPPVLAEDRPGLRQGVLFLPAATKFAECVGSGGLPDPGCTPGAVSDRTTESVCTEFTSKYRAVRKSTKRKVFASYKISQGIKGEYEVDHLIPLELGGSNDQANLWIEPASPRPGFHEKDRLENYLYRQVCTLHTLTLAEAQYVIATDWVKKYKEVFVK